MTAAPESPESALAAGRTPVDRWPFGIEAAARLVARTSWPNERPENRDQWALRMLDEPEFAEVEFAAAEGRLLSAITMLRARHLLLQQDGCYICRPENPDALDEGCDACDRRSDEYHAHLAAAAILAATPTAAPIEAD